MSCERFPGARSRTRTASAAAARSAGAHEEEGPTPPLNQVGELNRRSCRRSPESKKCGARPHGVGTGLTAAGRSSVTPASKRTATATYDLRAFSRGAQPDPDGQCRRGAIGGAHDTCARRFNQAGELIVE